MWQPLCFSTLLFCGVVWCGVVVVWYGCGVVWLWCGAVWCSGPETGCALCCNWWLSVVSLSKLSSLISRPVLFQPQASTRHLFLSGQLRLWTMSRSNSFKLSFFATWKKALLVNTHVNKTNNLSQMVTNAFRHLKKGLKPAANCCFF